MPLSTNFYSWHNVVRQTAFSWHLPNSGPSISLPDRELRFTTPQNTFPLLQSPVVVCFTTLHPTLCIALGDVRLACSSSATETHSMKFSVHSFCSEVMPEEVRNSAGFEQGIDDLYALCTLELGDPAL